MKYCRFEYERTPQFGLIETIAGREEITRVSQFAPDEFSPDAGTKKISNFPLREATLLSPIIPSKIVCVGRNYREHAAELGNEVPQEPLLFLKVSSSLLSQGGVIRRPKLSERVDFEGELAVVIGKTCYQPAEGDDIRKYILGYTC